MKFMYTSHCNRTYGARPHKNKEVEMSLKGLMELTKSIKDKDVYFVISSIDPDGTFHIVRYDSIY